MLVYERIQMTMMFYIENTVDSDSLYWLTVMVNTFWPGSLEILQPISTAAADDDAYTDLILTWWWWWWWWCACAWSSHWRHFESCLKCRFLFCCCTKLSKNGQDMVMMITATRRWWHWWWWKQGIRFEVRTCLLLPGLACKTPFWAPNIISIKWLQSFMHYVLLQCNAMY